MNKTEDASILIVDDEDIIRGMLEIELQDKYKVYTAENAEKAFYILEETPVSLIISDINMPGMKGYELLSRVKKNYPHVKRALITSYNTDDYIKMALENDISNIIPKSTPFNFDEFNSIVYNLVTEKIFGLKRYMLPDYNETERYKLRSTAQISSIETDILEKIQTFYKPEPFVQVLLEELITNAIYHAPVDENGNEKYDKHSEITLEEYETVKISLGKDSEKYGVSVLDTSGKLTKEQVLYRIDRHIRGEGLLDEHGRGLHMSRMYSDRLIINIKKDSLTEVIFINYIIDKYKGFKPLYINEI